MSRVRDVNARAPIVKAGSPVRLDDPSLVRGRRVLVVEDGPTVTHGSMPHGAGFVAATEAGATAVIDPRPYATPAIAEVFARYPHLGPVVPAIGYGPDQLRALEETIGQTGADVVVSGTPVDLGRLLSVDKPVVRARYEFAEASEPGLGSLLDERIARLTTRS